MKNLKSVIQYECATSFKYIWFFYAIECAVVALIALIIGLGTGTFDSIGSSCLEINSLIFVGILGVLGFKEDFKMLIQNGFTRKYIFIATLSLFCFVSGIMAAVDTAAGNILHYFNNSYGSFYGGLYGYENIFMNWLWLFLVYVGICSLCYLFILVLNKVGKTAALCLGVCLGGVVLLIIALFRFTLFSEAMKKAAEFMTKAMGFMTDGTINYLFPVLTLFLVIAVLGGGSYAVIRYTELK